MILVSACLLGENCKYDGNNNNNLYVKLYLKDKDYIAFCPEIAGGLEAPRLPCERCQGRVINSGGEDLTDEFVDGAEQALELCQETGATLAVLKEGSPSCGVNWIYDGSFEHIRIPGQGVTAQLLTENGIKCISEEDIINGRLAYSRPPVFC